MVYKPSCSTDAHNELCLTRARSHTFALLMLLTRDNAPCLMDFIPILAHLSELHYQAWLIFYWQFYFPFRQMLEHVLFDLVDCT